MAMTISEKLANLGEKLRYEDLPDVIKENSKKFILDVLGCIVGAKEVASSAAITDTVQELGGNPDSTVLGYGFKTAPTMAALANATMGHAFDMDDDHREGTLHPTVVVFPAILSLAEKYGMDGKSVLTAFVFGSELAIRLGEAFLGQSYFQGFHPTGTCGVFGAAAGAAKLLGLGQDKITLAIGIAGSEAAGLLEWKAQGTWTKRFQAGHAAMGGVLAALMAKRGYAAPNTILEGADGFIRAYSYKDIYDNNRITDKLGEKWEMQDTSIKVHACNRLSAPLADCALDLYQQGVRPDDVEEIYATGSKFSLKLICDPPERKYEPLTVVDAQFSLPYTIAVGLVKGRESIFEYTDEVIKDKKVIELCKKVKWEVDPEAEKAYPKYFPATVIVKTKDGKEYKASVDYPKGDPENPVSYDEVEDKFRLLAGQTIGQAKINRVLDYVANLEKLDNLKDLIKNLY